MARAAIAEAARILRAGGTVAFATETVYGLGANALNPAAVAKVFIAKERPSWDPLIVHVCDQAMLAQVVGPMPAHIAARARALMDTFWPGPLSLLLPKHADVPAQVTAGRERIGVRMPGHAVALELIRAAGVPIAAPSANRFGHTSPTTAAHVLDDLDGRIDAVLDCGPTSIGVESTVVDIAPDGEDCMLVYRPGGVTLEMLTEVAGAVRMYASPVEQAGTPESLPSPGVGLRHYAPRARLVLVESAAEMRAQIDSLTGGTARIGMMLPLGWPAPPSPSLIVFPWAADADADAQARTLFAGLRELDARGAEVIVCPLPAAVGLGVAMRDRILKAARKA